MKKIYSVLFIFIISITAFAQAPNKMSYQAVIRNVTNNLVINQSVGIRISILQNSPTGTSVYTETQTVSTNANGLVSLEIGGGTIVSGNFSTVDWGNGSYYIKTETDPTGGISYSITGASQLLSVPYALYSKSSGSSTPVAFSVEGNIDAIASPYPANTPFVFQTENFDIGNNFLNSGFTAPTSGIYAFVVTPLQGTINTNPNGSAMFLFLNNNPSKSVWYNSSDVQEASRSTTTLMSLNSGDVVTLGFQAVSNPGYIRFSGWRIN